MTATQTEDVVRLRIKVYDALVAAKGYQTRGVVDVTRCAKWHGISRSNLYRLRSNGGGRPSAAIVMRIAADLDVPVEAIWERV